MRFRLIIFAVVFGLLLSACGASETPVVTSTPVPTDTSIPLPTLTATPVVPLAILVLPSGLDQETSDLYQKTVYDLAQASGFRFQVRNELTAADVAEPGLQIVIILPPDPGVAALAAAAPGVQFLAINIDGLSAGGNISVLGGSSQVEIAGFLAGYTAAMLTEDYRIGMLMPRDNSDAIRMYNAYVNGMKYSCGLCRPFYYYDWSFPQFIDIGADEDKAAYGAYADILMQRYKVRTILIHPGIYTQDLVDYIGTTGTSMIGTVSPEQRPAGWIMTIQPDTIKAIQSAWPQLVAGQGGITVQSPLGLSDVDPSLLSPGKQQDVQQTLDELQAGLIAP